jgi:hypothetical protein
MRTTITAVLVTLAFGGLVAGCAERPKEWMKVNREYTTADFRRDYSDCTRKGDLDEECMKSKGWVTVTPAKDDTKTAPDNYRRPQERR